MELREKVTISLVIIALTQIACRHCMPRTPRKASLKRYLNDLKPVKNNPASTLYSPSKVNKIPKQTFGKTAQNGRINQNSLPKKSLFNTYNFPEIEYPLDNAPRDPFRIGMNFNENNNVNTLLKARNLQSSAINDLKKEIKMKRKLLSNKQMNNENIPLKTDISSIKITSNPDSVRLLDPETFPEVQYPLNTMETWGQNYWNYLPFTQEKQLNGLGQQVFKPKAREGINQPFTRLTKAEASKFLQSYDKLKDEHRRTSTENSKRSSVGQKGLNFTKTATCERDSDDFITAGLLSNTLVNPSYTKTLEANNAENTCSLIENPYHPMPLPYKVIEENIENFCPAFQLKNNTQELEDVDSSVISKTLQLIEEILLNGDTSSKVPPKNKNKEKDNNVNTTETDYTGGSADKDIPINPIDNAETSTVEPIEELSQEISDDAQADILPYNLPSLPEETIPENTTIVAGPCQNVRIPLPFTDSITYSTLTNASSPDLTNTTTLSNVNTVPGYTSIIIIPMNNDAVGKSHMFDTTSDTPIIVYLPSTQSSSIPSQTPPLNHIVSSSLGSPVTNNQPYNILSNMASVQNDNPSSTALVSELLNSISDSGSSLPIHETLPTNSKYYNNENSPSSMREKPVSDILIHKSLIDDAPFVTPSCDEILCQQPVDTDNFDIDPETLPPTLDFEHPVFDFAGHDITLLSHGPYKNALNNELSIIAREIDSDQQSNDTSSKDLFIATQNITKEHLHKTNSLGSVADDSFPQNPNGVPTVAKDLDKDFSSETPTDSPEILKNLDPSDSLSNLPVSTDKPIFLSPISKQFSESLQLIDKMPPTLLADTPTVKLPPPTQASLTPTALSKTFFDKLPEIRDTKVSNTKVSDITSESAPQPIDNNPVPSPILNSTPMTTDLTVKTELYKIRQILDRMLEPPSMDLTFSPISETDSLPLLVNQSLPPIQTPTDRQPPPLGKVLPPISDTDSVPLLEEQSLSPIQTPTDSQSPPLDKVLSPISDTDSLPLLENRSFPPIETTTDSQPPPLDKVLPPISDTGSVPLLEEQTLSPIQTPTDSQPAPVDKVLSPIQTPTDRQPLPLDNVLSPIQTPTDSQCPPLDKVISPISDTDSLPLLENRSLPPIETTTDSQSPPLDKVLPPISDTGSVPLLEEQTLSPIQTPTDSQPAPVDKVLSPIQTPTDRQPIPLVKVLSPISDTDSLPLLKEQSLSPIHTLTDSQPAPLDDVLSPIQTPTDRHSPPLVKVLPPISDTDSVPLLEEQALSPIQTPTDSQPAPVDKVLSPIQTTTDSHPPPLGNVLSPIQTPTDGIPPPLYEVLSSIQTPIDRQPPPLDKVLSPIPTPTDCQPLPLDNVLSPIQTPTDIQPPPLTKVLSPISDTDRVPLLEEQSLSPIQTPTDSQPAPLDDVLSPILTPTDSQSPSLDKVLSPISDTDSFPLLENLSLSPIRTNTDSQPPPLGNVLSPFQTPTDGLPPPLYEVLSSIQTPTDSQPPPLVKVLSPISDTDRLPLLEEQSLSPIQTPTVSQPLPLDKVLPLNSDTDSLPLLENQSLSPNQTPTDSGPLLAVTDYRIDSLQLQDHETLLKTPIDYDSKDTLPSLMDKSYLLNSVLDNNESQAQSLEDIVSPIPLFETTIDNKPYLIDNLVTPLYEAVTSRNKDITKNGLPHKMDDLTFKMDLEFPDMYEVYNDDRPLSVDELPIKVHQENSESPLWMVDLPMDVVETPNLLSKTLISDLVKPSEMLSLPVEGVLEIVSPGFPSHSDMSLMSDSREIDHQHFPPSKDVSDDLPALPIDEFKSPIHEVIPNSQSHETSEIQPQKYDLPLRVDKLIPFLSDALSNEPFEIDDSPSPVTDKIPEIPNSTANTKDPPLIDNRLLSPEDDASPDTLVTDIPTTVLPSLNEALQSTNLDKTSDEVFSESTLSNLHRDNLSLPNDKTLPLPDNTLTNLLPSYKTLSSSKLPITKALLENVLSDITKGVLSSQVAKALPVTPPSDKTVYYVDEKSPLYEIRRPLQPVENSFSNAEDNDNLIDNLHVSQITEDIPTKDLPVEFQLPMDKMYNDSPEISTDNAGGDNENDTQTSNKLSDGQPLPNDKISPLTDILRDISRNEKSSSTKLPITKALLENVLSEINTKGFSIPVSKAVSATSTSVGDKTHYYIDSPHSDFTEDSPPLPEDKILPNTAHTDNNLPFSGQSEDTFSLEEDKTLSEIQRIDISTEISLPMDKIVPNDDLPSSVTEIVSFSKDAPSDSLLPNHKNKTPSSSKLPIAKALLENVLSDINTKGFSLPVAKALPIASRTQLDKTLYFLESPRPDTTVKSTVSDDPIENDHYSEIYEDVLPPSADKLVPDNPIIDIPTDELISGKMYEDNSDDLTEELEDSEETLVSNELTDDLLSEMEKPLSSDDLPDELSVPPTKQLFSSRLPITKALLQKVLSDITNGGLQPKIS